MLKAAPGDEDALRCKVVALIKADAIDRALLSIPPATAKGLHADLGFYKVCKSRSVRRVIFAFCSLREGLI